MEGILADGTFITLDAVLVKKISVPSISVAVARLDQRLTSFPALPMRVRMG